MDSIEGTAAQSELILAAPLEGWVVPLEDVPDPVFSQRMLGNGIAIDPVGDTLFSPIDGKLVSVHAAKHAFTLRSAGGVEILLHLGLDSVALEGAGMTVLAEPGGPVRVGQPLLRFDLDRLVVGAKAAVTPMIVADPEAFDVEQLAAGMVAAGDPLLRVSRRAASDSMGEAVGEAQRKQVRVALSHGLHARPAARVVEAVKRFDAEVAIEHGGARVPATSALGLLRLGAVHGAEVTIAARGADAAAALEAVAAVLLDASPEAAPATPAGTAAAHAEPGILRGVPAAPGLATGRAFRFEPAVPPQDEVEFTGDDAARFETALARTRDDLAAGAAKGGLAGAVFTAQLAMLDDPELLQTVRTGIENGRGASAAWRTAIAAQVEAIAALNDARLAERAVDLRDLEQRLLCALAGRAGPVAAIPEGSILIARELLPSQVAALDASKVAGVALVEGGPTSHAAILAAGAGIPMAVAFGVALDSVAEGAPLVLDADQGRLETEPAAERLAEVQSIRSAREALARRAVEGPCRTADGTRIEIFANLGSLADAEAAVEKGAEGCGLLRTEFLFLDRSDPPGETEQRDQYQAIADALGERPLIVRLLDVGGDKPAPYLSIPPEENPALGLRGIRVGLARPELLDTQLRAIMSVRPPGRCRIMPPMVASLAELEAVAERVERISAELNLEAPVELGVMIETPAAALTADILARRADFFSIGTNDLAQYVLAMDRGNAAVAAQIDGLHPAVLRLIATACSGAEAHKVPVGVCGGLAADRLAVPVLIGIGVTELSMPPARIPAIRAEVGRLSLAACRSVAAEVLKLDSAEAVRARLSSFLEGQAL